MNTRFRHSSVLAPRLLLAVMFALVQGALHSPLHSQTTSGTLLIEAGRIVPVEGKEISSGQVLINKGIIERVGTGLKLPAGTKVLRFPDGVAFPGFVDAGSHLGLYRHRDESTRPLLPGLRMEDAFNPYGADFKDTLRAGITAMHLIPGDQDIVGGQTAVVEVRADGRPRFLTKSAGVKLSLISSAWPRGREPTSSEGAAALISDGRKSHPVLEELCSGKRRAFISTGSRGQVDLACRLPGLCGIKGVLIGGPETRFFATAIKAQQRGVIMQPVLPAADPIDRKVPGLLEKAGVAVAFMTTSPVLPAASLRLQAQVAVKAGLSREAAHRALTINPAAFLGLDSRIGSLTKGKQGDVVVLSGDPTDPRARILAVIQNGEIAWQAEDKQ